MRPALILGAHASAYGDSPKVCEELAERLRASGRAVLVASTRRQPLLRAADIAATAWRAHRRYEVAQVDVYSGRAFWWARAAAWALRARRKPFALTLHGGALPEFAARNERAFAALLDAADAVTTPSEYLRRAFTPWERKIRVIPNAVDLARLPHRVRDRPAPRLIWLRAFHEIYNSILAVETLARLTREFPGVGLAMIGPDRGDGSEERAREAARRFGLGAAVAFEGRAPKSEIGGWLARADIFLNTSRIDNAPVSVLEAMAAGLCVVSTRVGGIPDLLADGEDALLVPPGDPAAMAAAVQRLLREPGLARRLSENARRKALGFDWSRVLPRWNALLDGLETRR